MGSYWVLNVGGDWRQMGKSEVPLEIAALFTPSEFVEEPNWADYDLYRPNTAELVYGYRSTVGAVVARLELMGFAYGACRNEIVSAIRDYYAGDEDDEPWHHQIEEDGRPLTADEILDRGIAALPLDMVDRKLSPVDDECASDLEGTFLPDMDQRAHLALQLREFGADVRVELDLRELRLNGYLDGVDDLAGSAIENFGDRASSFGPVIVVTEGRTDAEFLKAAFDIAAPAVSHLFKFLDFSLRPEGGADAAVKAIRSFAAAGVTNRIVGVFDNDTAGRRALKALDNGSLPPSVRYLTLPYVDYASAYPTLGPSGAGFDDVNGSAASIEFQFGLDCLKASDGTQVPVRWTGFEKSIQAYQGELTNKDVVQGNIRTLLADGMRGHDRDAEPWPTVYALVNALVATARADRFPGQEHDFDGSA